jgi:hypothetical protein
MAMTIPREVEAALRSFIASCQRQKPFRGFLRPDEATGLEDESGGYPSGLVERDILSMSWESSMPSSSISWGCFLFEDWQIFVHRNDNNGESPRLVAVAPAADSDAVARFVRLLLQTNGKAFGGYVMGGYAPTYITWPDSVPDPASLITRLFDRAAATFGEVWETAAELAIERHSIDFCHEEDLAEGNLEAACQHGESAAKPKGQHERLMLETKVGKQFLVSLLYFDAEVQDPLRARMESHLQAQLRAANAKLELKKERGLKLEPHRQGIEAIIARVDATLPRAQRMHEDNARQARLSALRRYLEDQILDSGTFPAGLHEVPGFGSWDFGYSFH